MEEPPTSSAERGNGRHTVRALRLVTDLAVLSAAYWMAFVLRFEFLFPLKIAKLFFFTWPYVVLFQYVVLVVFEVPSLAWRYVGIREAGKILRAVAVSIAVLTVVRLGFAAVGGHARFVRIPLGVLAMDFMIAFLGLGGVRVLRRVLAERQERARRVGQRPVIAKRTLLVGAGQAGVLVAREIRQRPDLGLDVVGFIDDDVEKQGTVIHGFKVLADQTRIKDLVKRHKVEQVIITMASAAPGAIRAILRRCEAVPVSVKIIPGVFEIIGEKVNLTRIREVTIEDLLGRDSVQLETEAIEEFLANRSVMVTGAGGSIGSELCRQVLKFSPARLLLVERGENALFNIHREFIGAGMSDAVVPVLCDVADPARVEEVFEKYQPDVVFHAAAHKHVPMLEWNPGEAVKNNILGTKNIADAADRWAVSAFVLISTDKAVRPTSVMGCTKRVAEVYIQSLSEKSGTRYLAVRFGNVLGSAGSVVPIFKEQIRGGGPITVTHPEMKRYFMTIPEACQLVMEAGAIGHSGEILVLDMGQPVKIVDLARDLIRLSGFGEDEIPIVFSGVRPGEKLFEELASEGENLGKTRHPKVFIGNIARHPRDLVWAEMQRIAEKALELRTVGETRGLLAVLVPEMQPAEKSEVAPDADDVAHEEASAAGRVAWST